MIRDYEQIAARFWNLPSKGQEEASRGNHFMDDLILQAHLEREIGSCLDGVHTVLDAGAGSGRFTIPLAKRGLAVTHLDISRPMIETAKARAAEAGVAERITFVQDRLTSLSQYPVNAFDLVISTDAPVSYCYPQHDVVLAELVRVARRAVVISVSSRLGYLPYFFNPIQKLQYLIDEQSTDPVAQYYIRKSESKLAAWQPDFACCDQFMASGLTQDPDQLYDLYEDGKAPWPPNYCFTPEELQQTLAAAGLHQIRLAGPGALARSIPQSILNRVLMTPEHRDQFLAQCYRFDSQPSVCGLGKDNLVAVGRKV